MNHQDLPVYANRGLILSALKESQVLVVESPTGSGKTTGLPLILHEAGFSERGMIGVTQPRRIAAVSVSEFIARQLGTTIPGIVGYKMRFEDRTARETKIKIMTDGMLLQEMKLDPWLSKYAVLLVDEAHERSLTIDFILGLLKRVLENRKDFKVLISSATINTGVFSAYFGDCPIVKIDAGHFPITLVYEPPAAAAETDRTDPRRRPPFRGKIPEGKLAGFSGDAAQDALLDKVGTIITRFVHEKRDGDILVFLPGEKMIKECMGRLISGPLGKYLYVIPLYGRLGKEEQERVFPKAPRGKTKVVLSTNIAETSITNEGITAVIDS
ncbi:MAG: DEAD/DEAH box helicase, partial [Treponema sp.]|nr:DEAD/DEAH box helicase [Treponema sp.]